MSANKIDGASSAAYTPKIGDYAEDTSTTPPTRTRCLQAQATYTDNIDPNATTATVLAGSSDGAIQKSDPANTAPKFVDQDLATSGDQSDETSRSVAENADKGTSVGQQVSVDDADDDLLILTLGGADADSFKVTNAGQLTTNEKFDYETKNVYMVVITATDPSGAQDSILVTVNITDQDDDAVIGLNAAPEFADDSAERSVDENSEAGTSVGDPVTATRRQR